MIILNLGCGTKTSGDPAVMNVDWNILLRIRRNPLLRPFAPWLLRGSRWEAYRSLPVNIVVHNLARGIPCADRAADAVYHSHLMEHLDRPVAREFMKEVHRVLRPGGIQRIVLPDLELLGRRYLESLEKSRKCPACASRHDESVAGILEQCVRREASGTSRQPGWRRTLENLLLGDARRRGETHQWMYDEVNLGELLRQAGFVQIERRSFDTSGIARWNELGLDLQADGSQRKEDSLYLEAIKA